MVKAVARSPHKITKAGGEIIGIDKEGFTPQFSDEEMQRETGASRSETTILQVCAIAE